MANDAFSAQIVDLVRKMPDEAILALVKNQLGVIAGVVGAAAAAPAAGARRRGRPPRSASAAAPAPAAPAASAKPQGAASKRAAAGGKRKPGRPRRSPAASQERQDTLNNVERIVKQSQGVSASDVAKSAGIPQTRAAAALKELKLAKRIFQGGDRRFARYAGDAKAAEQASLNARKNASGPAAATGGGKKTAAKPGRKRASSAAAAAKQ